jgi:predicted nicotinamide N-methyase
MSRKTQQQPPKAPSRPLWPDAGLDDLLTLARQKHAVAFEPLSVGGVTLQVLQITDMRERLDRAIAENALADAINTLPLWAKVWPASLILGHMLRHVQGKDHRILEVGAGCGAAGLAAAALGLGKVCVSDVNEDALLFARINIARNGLDDVAEVRRVDVAEDALDERFSLILGAEILYLDHLYRPLVKFFQRRLDPAPANGAQPQILLASDHRRKAAPFFKQAEKVFRISQRHVGAKEKETQNPDARAERLLIALSRLTLR